MNVALVGAGAVGTAVTALLQRAGHEVVGVSSRSRESEARATRLLEARGFDIDELPSADVVLLGVADAAIASVAERLSGRMEPGTYVCHFAGSFGIAPLSAVGLGGGHPCALHPVQPCPDVTTAIARLPGSAWGVTCENAATESWAVGLIEKDLQGHPVVVAEGERALWHAAAVATSNGIAALLGVGESILTEIGIEDPQRVLGPLAAGAVRNAQDGGGGAATLTGPIVRGDLDTVSRHIEELKDRSSDLKNAYVMVGRLIVQAAQSSGRLDAESAMKVIRVLEGR